MFAGNGGEGAASRAAYRSHPPFSSSRPQAISPWGIHPIRGARARGHSAECPCLRLRAFRAKPGSPAGQRPAGERTSKEAGGVFAIPGGNGVQRTLRGRLPPGCPPPLSEGVRSAALRVTSLYGEYSTLTLPSFVPLGDTSNKGARSLVLTNSGPLRPPVRRTSASLRCSSSPNGNGCFRWERSRSGISELSLFRGSERYAACGDAFGRCGWGLSRGGGVETFSP